MSEDKLKPIPIKDFLFAGLSHRKSLIHSGSFPKSKTKGTFQMPRKLPNHKILVDYPSRIMTDTSFLRNKYMLNSLLGDVKRSPPLIFHNANPYKLQLKTERNALDIKSPRSCPLTSLRVYKRERPKTSVMPSIKVGPDEHFGSDLRINTAFDEKKTEKIRVFIKSPTIEQSSQDCSFIETNYS
jgi:hypothetical protein